MDTTRLCSVALHSPAASRNIGILLKRQRSLSAAAQRFLDTLRQTDPG
jgi:hypothetical protein